MSHKTSFKEEVILDDILAIYRKILRGERKTFPRGTWQRPDALNNAGKVVRYLLIDILGWSREDICSKYTINILRDYKLGSLIYLFPNDFSVYMVLNNAFPNKFKPWELATVPRGYWTIETGGLAVRWLLTEKLHLDREGIVANYNKDLIYIAGFKGLACMFSPLDLINSAFPNEFKPWEFSSKFGGYWTDNTRAEALRLYLSEHLKLSLEDICKVYNKKFVLDDVFLKRVLANTSIYKVLSDAYIGKFLFERKGGKLGNPVIITLNKGKTTNAR